MQGLVNDSDAQIVDRVFGFYSDWKEQEIKKTSTLESMEGSSDQEPQFLMHRMVPRPAEIPAAIGLGCCGFDSGCENPHTAAGRDLVIRKETGYNGRGIR